MKGKRRRVMLEVDKRPASSYRAEEFIIANSGKRKVTEVNVGGKTVKLGPSGATTYDKVLAGEIKDKYKNDPNVIVIHKSSVTMDGIHQTHHTVPALPWHDDE